MGRRGERRKILQGSDDLSLDLHGYNAAQAIEVADKVIREAQRNGYPSLTIIHGCPDVRTPDQITEKDGPGNIKFDLRDRLAKGAWSDIVGRVSMEDGSLTVDFCSQPNAAPKRLTAKGLPKPRSEKDYRSDRRWFAIQQEVDAAYPILASAAAKHPDLVKACRRAICQERLYAELEEHKRNENPAYRESKAYVRSCRHLEKARAKAVEKLAELESALKQSRVNSLP